jgi:hypothetical protein
VRRLLADCDRHSVTPNARYGQRVNVYTVEHDGEPSHGMCVMRISFVPHTLPPPSPPTLEVVLQFMSSIEKLPDTHAYTKWPPCEPVVPV